MQSISIHSFDEPGNLSHPHIQSHSIIITSSSNHIAWFITSSAHSITLHDHHMIITSSHSITLYDHHMYDHHILTFNHIAWLSHPHIQSHLFDYIYPAHLITLHDYQIQSHCMIITSSHSITLHDLSHPHIQSHWSMIYHILTFSHITWLSHPHIQSHCMICLDHILTFNHIMCMKQTLHPHIQSQNCMMRTNCTSEWSCEAHSITLVMISSNRAVTFNHIAWLSHPHIIITLAWI